MAVTGTSHSNPQNIALLLPKPETIGISLILNKLAGISTWAADATDAAALVTAWQWTLAVEKLLSPMRAHGPAQTAARLLEARIGSLDVPEVGGRGNRSLRGTLSRSRRSEFRLMASYRELWEPQLPLSRARVIGLIRGVQQANRVRANGSRPGSIDLRQGDFRHVLADVPDESVDLILTDPPYAQEFLPLWEALGAFGERVLKPNGLLVAMAGQIHLPEVMRRLGVHLRYRWTIAHLLLSGSKNPQFDRKVRIGWKPVVVYARQGGRPVMWLDDVVSAGVRDKRFHPSGQSVDGFRQLLRMAAEPGQIVCDPFLGGGTTAVVSHEYGCDFIGAEVDPATHGVAMVRLGLGGPDVA